MKKPLGKAGSWRLMIDAVDGVCLTALLLVQVDSLTITYGLLVHRTGKGHRYQHCNAAAYLSFDLTNPSYGEGWVILIGI